MSTTILKEPIEKLPISEELQDFMFRHHYRNLEELVQEGTVKLQRTEGFTDFCFESLLDVLDQNDIMSLLNRGDD